jgi:hypothetical protein
LNSNLPIWGPSIYFSSLKLTHGRRQHDFSKDMELFMRIRIICFRILSLDTKRLKTFLAIIKIKALIALVPYICNGHCATPITFDWLFYCLTRLHYYLNTMVICWVIVAANLQTFERCSEVAVLTYSKMRASGTNKTSSYYRLSVTAYTLVIAMGRQPIS